MANGRTYRVRRTHTVLGTSLTANGVDYDTVFANFTPSKPLIRFGIGARNQTGSDVEACRASLRIDWRG